MMKPIALVLAALLFAPAAAAQPRRVRANQATEPARPQAQAAAQTLPLRRVVLYSNGVAYVERRGTVQGRAEISLSFKQSQVDDVLKSMVVLDLGRGRIGAVSYNSSAPPSARLAEIPFSVESGSGDEEGQEGGSGLAAVLRQLQGARVVVTTATRAATGAILSVEERRSQIDAQKPPVITRSLVISSESGELASFDLAEVRSVRLLDEGARQDVNEFAAATAATRRRDAKTIVVTSDGSGAREMVVSYTVAAPIWKTTYRVVFDTSGKPFFQGWAVVDNVGDEDWNGVALSLVSGAPVSFIQPVQQPLYRYRPVVPIPEDLKLTPQVYEAAEGYGVGYGPGEGGVPGGTPGGVAGGIAGRAKAPAPTAPPPPPQSMAESVTVAANAAAVSDAISSGEAGVEAAATGSEVGDLFEYRIDQPVTVPRNRSALIPILQTRLEGERVSIYNERARADRPMSGLLLKNTSPLTLEGGALTVIDGDAYAGEALMERLKPGEERLISFALDLGTLVTARTKEERQPAFLARVVNGVFQAHYYQARQKTYTVTNQTDRPRTVYVEHPATGGWVLSDATPKPAEKTASTYRFRLEVKPRSTVELPVIERRALMDTYAVSNLTPRDVELFVTRGYLDEAARAALDRIFALKGRVAEVNARIAALEREAGEITADQARLRENIKALNDTAEARQLIARYIAKATQQEGRLEQLTAERRAANEERTRLQAELDEAVRRLALERKL